MGTIKDLEREMEICRIAMKVWPEHRDEYSKALARMAGVIGRTRRARRRRIAKSYGYRSSQEKAYRESMSKQ